MKLLIIISHQLNGFRMTANDVSQLLGFQVAIALLVFINIKNREYMLINAGSLYRKRKVEDDSCFPFVFTDGEI